MYWPRDSIVIVNELVVRHSTIPAILDTNIIKLVWKPNENCSLQKPQ